MSNRSPSLMLPNVRYNESIEHVKQVSKSHVTYCTVQWVYWACQTGFQVSCYLLYGTMSLLSMSYRSQSLILPNVRCNESIEYVIQVSRSHVTYCSVQWVYWARHADFQVWYYLYGAEPESPGWEPIIPNLTICQSLETYTMPPFQSILPQVLHICGYKLI